MVRPSPIGLLPLMIAPTLPKRLEPATHRVERSGLAELVWVSEAELLLKEGHRQGRDRVQGGAHGVDGILPRSQYHLDIIQAPLVLAHTRPRSTVGDDGA